MKTTIINGTIVFCSRKPKPRAVIAAEGRHVIVNFTDQQQVHKGQKIEVEGEWRFDEDDQRLNVLDDAVLLPSQVVNRAPDTALEWQPVSRSRRN